MKKIISEQLAGRVIMIVLALTVLMHFLIITGVIPFQSVWGGRLKDRNQMVQFETISIAANLTMLLIVMLRSRVLRINVPNTILTIALWAMSILFLLNTVGNIFSENEFEKYTFTPVTLILSFLCVRMALGTKAANQ